MTGRLMRLLAPHRVDPSTGLLEGPRNMMASLSQSERAEREQRGSLGSHTQSFLQSRIGYTGYLYQFGKGQRNIRRQEALEAILQAGDYQIVSPFRKKKEKNKTEKRGVFLWGKDVREAGQEGGAVMRSSPKSMV